MNNQFVRPNSYGGNESLPRGQTLPPGEEADGDQSQGGSNPFRLIPQRPGATGLLSNWKAGRLQHPSVAGIPSLISVAEQNTLKQSAIVDVRPDRMMRAGGPATGISLDNSNGAPSTQMYMRGPVSPHESGISALPAMRANAQTLSPPMPMQYPTSQPLPPMYQTPAQQLVPMVATPMGATPLTPAPPMGYPGNPPPFVQPPGASKGSQRKKRRFPIWARVVLAVFLVLFLGTGGALAYYYTTFSAPVNNIVGKTVPRSKGEGDPNVGRSGNVLSGGRINILLLGSDTDEKFKNADGSYSLLAQTDIVVTIDPASKQVGMLSIPRDFWIPVPGYGMHKLDEAYGLGVTNGNVALSRLTIEQDFGIPINYYAWVGLDGFVKVINTVNGVDVDAIHPITDDNYPDDVGNPNDPYALKRLYIAPGPQHFNGPQALEYVRSRHADLVGDFGRSARQQQVLNDLKIKLSNAGIIGQLPALAQDLNGWVRTDMQLTQVLELMNFARSLDTNKVQRVILGPPYSSTGTTSDGKSVVYPNCSKIVPVIAQMFALGNRANCVTQLSSSNNSSALASAAPSSSAVNAIAQTASNNGLELASQMAQVGVMSVGNGSSDLFGMRSLLDLLFAVVFDDIPAFGV